MSQPVLDDRPGESDDGDVARLVESHLGLAKSLAGRWGRRVADQADVTQVALLGLVRAARAYDPSRGTAFSTFAFATITGDIRRYYRDATWRVHVPRSMQEDYLAVAAAREHLTHDLGRPPTIPELAARTGLSQERVIEATEVRAAYDVLSIDEPAGAGRSSSRDPGEFEEGFAAVDRSDQVAGLLRRLPPREREVVLLRFFQDCSQLEIANQLGVSQMQVSRLLRRSLERLRALASHGPPESATG